MSGGVVGAFVVALCIGAGRGLTGGGSSPAREVRDLVRPLHTRSMWKSLGAAALFGSVLGLLPYHLALRDLPGGVAAVLFATTPLFTLPLGLLFGERHGLRAVLGTLIGFAGVVGVVWSLG
jgi:drug/metabolite transporter (DMT)-like permease